MNKNSLQKNEVRAVSKYIRMSPSKIRRVLRQIQGKTYKEALLLLEFILSLKYILHYYGSWLIMHYT